MRRDRAHGLSALDRRTRRSDSRFCRQTTPPEEMKVLQAFSILLASSAFAVDVRWQHELQASDLADGGGRPQDLRVVENFPDGVGGLALWATVTTYELDGSVHATRSLVVYVDRHGNRRYTSPPTIQGVAVYSVSPTALFFSDTSQRLHAVAIHADGSVSATSREIGTNETLLGNRERSDAGVHSIVPTRVQFDGRPITTALAITSYQESRATPKLVASIFGIVDGNAIIEWNSSVGQRYQVQRSSDLQSWDDVGLPIDGNGEAMRYSQPATRESLFLRVVEP